MPNGDSDEGSSAESTPERPAAPPDGRRAAPVPEWAERLNGKGKSDRAAPYGKGKGKGLEEIEGKGKGKGSLEDEEGKGKGMWRNERDDLRRDLVRLRVSLQDALFAAERVLRPA